MCACLLTPDFQQQSILTESIHTLNTFGHVFQNLLNTPMNYIFLTLKCQKEVLQLKILEVPYESRQCICRNIFPESHSDPLGEDHLPRERVQYYGIRET